MNLYFLVEGKTEWKIYPVWLSCLIPGLQKIKFSEDITENSYKIINANGLPLYEQLRDAVHEVNGVGNYDYLVVCLDPEEHTVNEVKADIQAYLEKESLVLENNTQLAVIVQNRCIEIWCIGNRAVYPMRAESSELFELMEYYNASENDPEHMGKNQSNTHAQFHKIYLKKLLSENGFRASGGQLRYTGSRDYCIQIVQRIEDTPDHLASFQELLHFCGKINKSLTNL